MTDPQTPQVPESAEYVPPTPEQIAERAARADKATRGALAATLCLEGVTMFLMPRAIAQTSVGLDTTKTVFLIGLAVGLIVVAFLQRRSWGIAVGSVGQALMLASSVFAPSFLVVSGFFAAVWGFVLHTRHQLVGTPSGWRILVS